MSRLSSKLTAVLMIVFISSVFLWTLFSEKEGHSSKEERDLASLPEMSFHSLYDGSVTEELSAYMADHFAARDTWISMNAKLSAELSESIVNGVYIGNDMLLDSESPELSDLSGTAYEINRFAQNYSGAVYIAAVPTSAGIYGEMLPEYMQTDPENRRINRFSDHLSGSIRRIDAYNILRSQKENYIYYRSDKKWTSYGAYYVYRTAIQKLGFNPISYDKYTIDHVSSDYRGGLYYRSQYDRIKPDIIDLYRYPSGVSVVSCVSLDSSGRWKNKKIGDRSLLGTGDSYKVFMGGSSPVTVINTSLNNDKKLLLIKDSYADCFIQFLIQHYSEITVVDPGLLDSSLSSLVDINSYEQTLFLFSIESLENSRLFSKLN